LIKNIKATREFLPINVTGDFVKGDGSLSHYDKLQTIGIDAVRIDKLVDLKYEINFSEIGSY